MTPWNVATVWVTLMKRCQWEEAQLWGTKGCRTNADVYSEPGSIDPVTMPYYSCCIAARGRCGFNHLANGCGCRMDALPCIPACIPACILMSLRSWQGHCTVELQPQFCFPDAQKPCLAKIKQITRYFLPPSRKHRLRETNQIF